MVEVRAATHKSEKKRSAKIYPPGIWEKIIGKIWKTRPKPPTSIGWLAKARVGKMISPARRAIKVSEKVTHPAEETRLSDLEI